MKTILSCDLRERITLLHLVKTQDDCGGWVETWTRGKPAWARVDPLPGRDGYHSDDLGGGMAAGHGYIKPLTPPRYRVFVRKEINLNKVSGLDWQIEAARKRLRLTQRPLLVSNHRFQCLFTMEDCHENQ